MEELRKRSAREVLDDHLNIANRWGPDDDLERIVQDDLDRNVAEDCVIDSYLIEDGRIVAQTIHYTVQQKQQAG